MKASPPDCKVRTIKPRAKIAVVVVSMATIRQDMMSFAEIRLTADIFS